MDFRTLSSVPLDLARGLGTVISRLDAALRRLDDIADGMSAMHNELVGMRGDLRGVNEGIDALRTDVRSLDGGVDGIRRATQSLDGKIDQVAVGIDRMDHRLAGLSESLEGVDALTSRLGRLSRKARPTPTTEPDAA